ncbi:MAG: putative hydro-lyase [Gemmataceae bacterium]|nr:putative hydro-lyase [Gemmataceae bacterium]
MTGHDVRMKARSGELSTPTPGLAPGFMQANLAVVPKHLAFDFLLFCQRNPKPCPLLDVCDAGDPVPRRAAPSADVRTDCPRYRAWRYGELVDEPTTLHDWWRDDLVSFLLGCSFTFESALLAAGLPVRHLEQGRNVPMYRTILECAPAGPFRGPMVVSMRPMLLEQAREASALCERFPLSHGAPIHVGEPSALGIHRLDRPDYGDAVDVKPGEVPVFWACGVTPQAVAAQARPSLLLTHSPGCMLVTDLGESG